MIGQLPTRHPAYWRTPRPSEGDVVIKGADETPPLIYFRHKSEQVMQSGRQLQARHLGSPFLVVLSLTGGGSDSQKKKVFEHQQTDAILSSHTHLHLWCWTEAKFNTVSALIRMTKLKQCILGSGHRSLFAAASNTPMAVE